MSDKFDAFALYPARTHPMRARVLGWVVGVAMLVGSGGAVSASDENTNDHLTSSTSGSSTDNPSADWLSHLNPSEAEDHVQAYQDYVEGVLTGDDATALRQLAVMAGHAEDWALAGAAASRFREVFGINEVVAIELDAWTRLDQMDKAHAALRAVLEATPSEWTGWAQLEKVLGFLSDQRQALALLDYLDQARAVEAHRPVWLTARARVLARLDEPGQALREIEAAIDLERTPRRMVLAVDFATKSHAFERALDWLAQLPDDLQRKPELGLAHAHVLRELNRPGAALSALESTQPTPEVLFRTAELAQEMGDAPLAEQIWEEMPNVDQDFSSKDAYYIGHTAQLMKHYGQAFSWFGQITEPPWVHEATLARGHLLLEFGRAQGWSELAGTAGKVRQALSDMRDEVRSEKEAQHAWALEISLLREAGDVEQAFAQITDALSDQPNDEFLLYMRAMLAIGANRNELAEQDLRRLIRLDRNNADALNALGYLLTDDSSRLREAYRLIHRALELMPDSPAILDSMGWVNYRLGRVAVAHEFLDRAYAMQPDPEILAHLVEVLEAQGETSQARALLAESEQAGP